MTVGDAVKAFQDFVKLFPEEERRKVFQSKEYTEWCVKNRWLVDKKGDENLTPDR